MHQGQTTQVQHLQIDAGADGQRIDNFLLKILKGVPKARIYSMLRTGEVRVDGGRVKAETRLATGQTLRLPPVRLPSKAELAEGEARAQEARIQQVASSLPILFERNGVLAVDKPAGLAVHGGSGIDLGVVEALRRSRPGDFLELVHRLDRDTSGLLLLASRRPALLAMHRQLREGLMRKRYLAVVAGRWPESEAGTRLIKANLLKTHSANGERWVRLDAKGQPSMTKVRLLARGILPGWGDASLLQCEPLTGRTHQIRVHLQSRGFPILGDPKYGEAGPNQAAHQMGLKRMFLHAWRLEFVLPGEEEKIQLAAEPSAELSAQLQMLQLKQSPRAA